MSLSSSSSTNEQHQQQQPSSSNDDTVIIAGAGIMGCTAAYYLALNFGVSNIILVDPTGQIAPAASGKAGGFLALDWNDYSPVGPLARRSFVLHQQLATDLGASRIDYRRLTCAAISVKEDGMATKMMQRPKGKKLQGIEWAEGENVMGMRSLGDENTIAQVHPKKLCQALWEETQKMAPNAKLVKGKVVEIVYDDDTTTTPTALVGAKLHDGTLVKGDALLFTCGPWTANIMTGVKYHSLIVPTKSVLSQCVFFSGLGDPEVYVRPDQTAYCTGFPDPPVSVSEQPGQEEVRSEAIAQIQFSVHQASNLLDGIVISQTNATTATANENENDNDDEQVLPSTVVKQACYLPSTPDGLPLMGAVPGKPHCYMAAGHSCWGILMGPATGEAMAHLIMTPKTPKTITGTPTRRKSSSTTSPVVDISLFDPSRMGNSIKLVP